MHVLHQVNPIPLQRVCRSRGIVSIKVEVEMFALIYKLDRWALLAYEFLGERVDYPPEYLRKSPGT